MTVKVEQKAQPPRIIISSKGTPGSAATVAVGSTTTLPTSSAATVTNSGTGTNAILNFGIPVGGVGPAGPANTLAIGSVSTGVTASATITGASPNQTLNLVLPKGDKGNVGDKGPTGADGPIGPRGVAGTNGAQGNPGPVNSLSIGTVTSGSVASATLTGVSPVQSLNLVLPRGDPGSQGVQGPPNMLSIGTVQNGPNAAATITGAAPNQTLNLTLSKGDQGEKGDKGDQGNAGPANTLSIGTVSGGASASATITGTAPSQTLNLILPKGDTGNAGGNGWTPVFGVVNDGERRVQRVTDWTGGAGTKPTTGQYVSTTGFVSDIALATNIRGSAGAGTGDMVASIYDPNGKAVDVFAMANMVEGPTAKILTATERTRIADLKALAFKDSLTAADVGAATSAQGAKADSSVQPAGLTKAAVGLSNVDNTSDASKPVSTAQSTAIGLKITKADDTALGGFTSTSIGDGTKSGGTYTPTPVGSNFRSITNNGNFTLAAPFFADSYNMTINITNGAAAGAITFTGFVSGFPKGGTLTTTNGHKFKLHISKTAIGVTATIEALQ